MAVSCGRYFRQFVFSSCLAVAGLHAPAVLADSPTVEIVAAEFGVFDASDPKRVVFEPAQIIPHREGQHYGWMIEVRTNKRSLSVREEYLLPSRVNEERTESPDGVKIVIPLERHAQVSQRQMVPVDGRIYGEWSIGPQEPAGRRQLNVIVEDKATVSFEFEIK